MSDSSFVKAYQQYLETKTPLNMIQMMKEMVGYTFYVPFVKENHQVSYIIEDQDAFFPLFLNEEDIHPKALEQFDFEKLTYEEYRKIMKEDHVEQAVINPLSEAFVCNETMMDILEKEYQKVLNDPEKKRQELLEELKPIQDYIDSLEKKEE